MGFKTGMKTSEDVLGWLGPWARHKTAHGNGWLTLRSLVDYDKLVRVHHSLSGVDDQSSKLLHEVMDKIGDELDMSRGAEEALGRLRQIADKGARWNPGMLRNNIFKAANSLGIKLPSGMFASSTIPGAHKHGTDMRTSEDVVCWLDRKASASMLDVREINKLTAGNHHNEAAEATAKLLKMKKHEKAFKAIGDIQDVFRHMPPELSKLRYKLQKEMYVKTKKIFIKDNDGKEVSLYELLD